MMLSILCFVSGLFVFLRFLIWEILHCVCIYIFHISRHSSVDGVVLNFNAGDFNSLLWIDFLNFKKTFPAPKKYVFFS